MGEYCSCGAALPPDARFCHKCGKPQGELPAVEADEPAEAVPEVQPPPAPAGPVPISFHNSVAVRVGFLAAGLISVLLSVPMPPIISAVYHMVLLLAGGFFSVFLYMRRTGEMLTVRSGARMGWITGVFCYAIMVVLFTIAIVALASGGQLTDLYQELANQAGSPEIAEQLTQFLQSPGGVATLFVGMLLIAFLTITLLPAIGGALGAKVLEKD